MTDTNEFRRKLQQQSIAENWQPGYTDPDLAELAKLKGTPAYCQHFELVLRSRSMAIKQQQDSIERLWDACDHHLAVRDRLERELRGTKLALSQARLLLLTSAMVLGATLLLEASRWL